MAKQTIYVPDIGGAENVDVIELSVAPGDSVAAEDSLLVLESDKASMDVPSPVAGKVLSFLVAEGAKISEGDAIAEIEVEGEVSDESASAGTVPASEPEEPSSAKSAVQESAGSAGSATGTAKTETNVAVPDIGGAENVDVIEVCVAPGDEVAEGDSLIVLESDKASMEVPSPFAGKVVSVTVKEGEKLSQGDAILVLASVGGETSEHANTASKPLAEAAKEPSAEVAKVPSAEVAKVPSAEPTGKAVASSGPRDVTVPDIGGAEHVDVIEMCVAVGDEVAEGDSLIVLESDKASMEVPSPASGKVLSLAIKEGVKVSEGSAILQLEVAGETGSAVSPAATTTKALAPQGALAPSSGAAVPKSSNELHPQEIKSPGSEIYAGPAVRKLARQLGVDLNKVSATGPRGRLTKDDVRNFVKAVMEKGGSPVAAAGGSGIPPVPAVDHSKFGEVSLQKLSKIQKLTAQNMARNWLNVPHVTQFDDADITELEAFRNNMKAQAEKTGVKLTPLPFLLKACAAALRAEAKFNVSLHEDGEHLVQKNYVNIGVAVDTPNGLMVPVVRDVDKKGLFDLAKETVELAGKARDGKLLPRDMQGGCFTISSLGPIGGKGFTPIVNAPEVAILGVSKSAMQPTWDGKEFVPRLMLPLCLSYDHRAINGADAGRFLTYLTSVLADIRRLLV